MDLRAAVATCQYQSWTQLFRKHRFKSRIVALPGEFRNYLSSDYLIVPSPAAEDEELRSPALLSLVDTIQQTIDELGPVVPKLNWSVPSDATWMHELRCSTAADVLLLLKASDEVAADLATADLLGVPLALSLVKHHQLRDGMQFRCFVKGGKLVAASQRDASAWHPFLKDMKTSLQEVIVTFFSEAVEGVFPLQDYTFDLYIDIPPAHKCWLLDFGPWDSSSDPGLFEWSDLESRSAFELLVAESSFSVRPHPFSASRAPVEMSEVHSKADFEEFLSSLQH